MKRIIPLLVILAAGLAAFLYLGPTKAPQMLVSNPIAVVLADDPTALDVFFTLQNAGGPDALMSVSSDAAETAEIIRPVGVTVTAIPAATSPVFSNDGVFLRLSGITSGTDDGTLVPLVLNFKDAGSLAFKARITTDSGMVMDHSMHNHDMPTAPAPHLAMTVTPQPDGPGWDLALDVQNFTFFKPADGEMMDTPGQGHAHLYLNGLKLGRLYQPTATIGALLPGTYDVRVGLNSNMHKPIMADGVPVSAQAQIAAE